MINFIKGGVAAPHGFSAGGVHCGIRRNKSKLDLALIYAEMPCKAAAVYTKNLVKGAPLIITKKHLENGIAQAVVCNSGIANTCNADGEEKAVQMANIIGKALNINPYDVIVASTGVIGKPLPIEPIECKADELVSTLSKDGGNLAAQAIMTTDTRIKEFAVESRVNGKSFKIGAIAKGSGMINPNMATMLSFITTDIDISSEMLELALKRAVNASYNMISVDGDTSTNDFVSVMASGKAENQIIESENTDFDAFYNALIVICKKLAAEIARDGEGATKLIRCTVDGAKDEENARAVAKSVISSSLVKAAMFGSDANWGRILCAIGYSGAECDINKVDVSFSSASGSIDVCKNGSGIEFSEEIAKEVLLSDDICIIIKLSDGNGSAESYGCDLTYDYVKINGDYRT